MVEKVGYEKTSRRNGLCSVSRNDDHNKCCPASMNDAETAPGLYSWSLSTKRLTNGVLYDVSIVGVKGHQFEEWRRMQQMFC